MKTITINGNAFSDLATFYDEIEKKFTKDFDGKMGRNLHAFNDVMHGGYLITEYDEPITIIWENSEKSKSDLGYEAQALAFKPDETQKARINQFNPDAFNFLQENYKKALKHEGPTLFENIIEIIEKQHDHIELKLR